MNKVTIRLLVSGAVASGLWLALPGYGQMGMMGLGHMMMNMSMVRHHFVMMNGIDPQYGSKENPLPATGQTIESGRVLFEQNCARCHGMSGLGDGPAGAYLVPPPANVAAAGKMPMASDAYLYWTIAEGGAPLGTAMPPFKEQLKEAEIWKIISYLRVM